MKGHYAKTKKQFLCANQQKTYYNNGKRGGYLKHVSKRTY